MSNKSVENWTTVVYKEDQYSEIISQGNYASNEAVFPKAVKTSFDGIAIAAGARLEIWEGKNFTGAKVLDQQGPAIINNSLYANAQQLKDIENISDSAWPEYPKSVRKQMFMKGWDLGSCRITCSAPAPEPEHQGPTQGPTQGEGQHKGQ